jgi:ABC-2 type transport system permease protein
MAAVAQARASGLSLLGRWTIARLKLTVRSSRAAFFTFVFPLLLLTLLNATSRGRQVDVPGGKVDFAQYFTPAIAIYALTVACYVTPIFAMAAARELGLLKRVRGTPLNPWTYMGAWLGAAILTGLASIVLLFAVAVPVFGVDVYPRLLPAAFVTAVLGAATLAATGLAVANFVRRAEAAPTIANLTLFPLAFLSGVFFPIQGAPEWVVTVAHVFPLSHIVEAFTGCFSPYTKGSGFAPRDLASVVAWGAAAMVVAVRRFRWETEESGGGTPRRRLLPRNLLSARRP